MPDTSSAVTGHFNPQHCYRLVLCYYDVVAIALTQKRQLNHVLCSLKDIIISYVSTAYIQGRS